MSCLVYVCSWFSLCFAKGSIGRKLQNRTRNYTLIHLCNWARKEHTRACFYTSKKIWAQKIWQLLAINESLWGGQNPLKKIKKHAIKNHFRPKEAILDQLFFHLFRGGSGSDQAPPDPPTLPLIENSIIFFEPFPKLYLL